MKAQMRQRPHGFTMVEVVMSAALLLVGVSGSVSALNVGASTRSHEQQLTTAMTAGETVMEELLVRYSGDPVLAAGEHAGPGFDSDAQRVSDNPTFTTRWTVTPHVPVRGMKEVKVTVAWREARGEQSISFLTHRR